ncbi:MAG: hypothetical protein NC127_02425 [Muribaculum sp.]|nr:hypothetical protein [Muribaculum sp.]
MINRILIRMKVVQMLYSYLLTRTDFKILPPPAPGASRDKRYAYSVYSDLLLLLLDLSGFHAVHPEGAALPRFDSRIRKGRVIDFTRIASAIAGGSDEIKEIALQKKSFIDALTPIRAQLATSVTESSLYKEFTRKRKEVEIQDEVQLWETLFRTVVLRDKDVKNLIDSDPDFTYVGYEQGVAMFERTLNDFSSIRSSLVEARRSLNAALDKSYELYHSLLQLMIDITRLRELQLDEAKHKYVPSHDDLNPNTRFVDNKFIKALADNADMQAYLDENPISWVDYEVTLRHLLDKIRESDTYKEYMAAPSTDMTADCEFWYTIFKNIIIDSDELAEALEEQSVYWNDDVNIMGSFVLKTIKRFASAKDVQRVHLLPKYKDDEDMRFGPQLFEATIRSQEEYRAMIDARLVDSSWDPERLAFMDIVILETAIAELLNFESIPTLVTVNEYTEIANYYSTAKSGQFITGMLYGIINSLKNEGLLVKE